MRVSDILKSCNISLSTLQSYAHEIEGLNFEFQTVNQFVPYEVFEKVKEYLEKRKSEKSEKAKIKLFIEDDNYVFVAKLKWYYNHQKEGEYGFVEKQGLPDIFFHKDAFKFSEPLDLKKDSLLVVKVAKHDIDNRTINIKAVEVYRLDDEKNARFLIYHFKEIVYHSSITYLETIVKQIEENSQTLVANEQFFEDIAMENISPEKVAVFIRLLQASKIEVTNFKMLADKLSDHEKFKIWLNNNPFHFSFKDLQEEAILYSSSKPEHFEEVLYKVSDDERINFADNFLKKILSTAIIPEDFDVVAFKEHRFNSWYGNPPKTDKSELYKAVIGIIEKKDLSELLNHLNPNVAYYLWRKKIVSHVDIDFVSEKLETFYRFKLQNEKVLESSNHDEIVKSVLNNLDNDQLTNLFTKQHYQLDTINNSIIFSFLIYLLSYIEDKQLLNTIVSSIYDKLHTFHKTRLFIYDFTDTINYDDAVLYSVLLNPEEQKLFFKKVIYNIEQGKLQLTLQDLNRIMAPNYQLHEWSKEIDGVGVDFTLSVILKIINDLSNNILTKSNAIFDLLAAQVKTPKDLLVITGFFDTCKGRTILKSREIRNEKEEYSSVYEKETVERFKPRFSTYCDGRKAIDKNTGLPTQHDDSGFEFWWCENQPCYQNCITMHNDKNWREYSLKNVLDILNIGYTTTQYEIVLNTINRVNRFLAHLTCKKCNSILKPKGKSNYTFYGVTWFYCDDKECEESGKEIYLSHCLNGHCMDIIDSRNTVKCKPKGHSEDCGWFICQSCYGCCSTEKISGRINILNKTGQEYKCHTIGHKDQGILCCTKCGNEMQEYGKNSELYKQQLQWFVDNKETHVNITKYGTRAKDGKYWFIWSRGDLNFQTFRKQLKGLLVSGFSIPDYEQEHKDNQLIAEPFINNYVSKFECLKCENVLDLNNREVFDPLRINSIAKFHTIQLNKIENM